MKRLLTAVSFAVLATPVFADAGKPFEQTELDRQLPAVEVSSSTGSYVADGSAPFEQTEFDRGLSNAGERRLLASASSGETRSDREIATDAGAARSVWASDHNFISPAQ